MLKTEPARYKVVDQHNNHLWLEVLGGGDQGIRVSVPLYHDDYADDLQEQVLELSVGDVVTVVLESRTEDRPDWRIAEINPEEGESRTAMPA